VSQNATALALEAAMPDAERALWTACQEGRSSRAREQLFNQYLPVARRIAWRFKRDDPKTPVEFAELMQLASLGLLQAIDRFKPELNIPFRYYCTRRVAGSIVEGIGKLSEVNQQITSRRRMERDRLRSVRTGSTAPQTLDGKLALIGDIAAELAIGLMLEDSVMYTADERDPARDAYETLAWKQAIQHLMRTLDGLPERERGIIRHHYLDGIPFDQIARLLGLSKGRISQLHKGAISLLRRRLSDMGRFRWQG
jgi:RNA polymerase sigma factor FliA